MGSDLAAVSDDNLIPYDPPTPSNEEWAECKAWAREFRARRRELERLARREWIGEVRQRLGLVTVDEDGELVFPTYESAWAYVRAEEAAFAAALPGRAQAIADALSEGLPDGMRFEWADGEL